jgi:glucosamine 6-phosphate synthetase-like amidotransferase/phosphosugar isomerase protein
MIQIEQHNCKNKRDAESTEQYWIEQLGATLNSNKPYAMCKEEEKIYKKNWYEEKKDYVLQKAKEQYEENKEQKIEYQKQYAEENKDKIKSYQDEYREKNKEQLYEQKKIYRAEHKEEASQAHKAWREVNKEKIREQKKQVINCECGCQYTFGNKHRHLKTKVHTDFLNFMSSSS